MKRVIVEKLDSAKLIKSCAVSVMVSASLLLGCVPTAAQVTSRWRTAHNFQPRPRSRAAQQPSAPAAEQNAAQKYFTDVVLVNQDGEKMRLYSDLLEGKVVIIDFFFATCQGSCLPMNRNLEKVQQALAEHIGKDLFIISISVDPTVDTPPKLKEYAKKLSAKR